ncbi:MAG: hypothetical protein HY744_31070 [Deltaproteobacteria bacterium]|nr:hypothetical protein [Deltaproteobacteria bacterium]
MSHCVACPAASALSFAFVLALAGGLWAQWQMPGVEQPQPGPAPTPSATAPPPYGTGVAPYGTGVAPYGAEQPQTPGAEQWAQPAQPYGQPVTAGGLEAPPPLPPSQTQRPPTETERKLDEAKKEDSERGLTWFWIEAEGGYQYVSLETFEADVPADVPDECISSPIDPKTGQLKPQCAEVSIGAGFKESSASGGFVGLGAGLRLVYFTLGPRFRVGFYPEYHLYSIGGELGVRIPIGRIEPYVNLGAGYSAIGNLSDAIYDRVGGVQVSGFDARIGAGLDLYIVPAISVGAAISWEFLVLTRPGVDPTKVSQTVEDLQSQPSADQAEQARAAALAAEGSGYGSAFSAGARLGIHF